MEVAGDPHRSAVDIGAVRIGEGQQRIDRRRRVVFGIAERAAMGVHGRRIVYGNDRYRRIRRVGLDVKAVGDHDRDIAGRDIDVTARAAVEHLLQGRLVVGR